jgi:hypothetical protein
MEIVDKKYREKEHDPNRGSFVVIVVQYSDYKRYMANDGVQQMRVSFNQANYLNALSADAQLFFIAFTHVDGTDGVANGIGRHILSYVGRNKSEDKDEDEEEEEESADDDEESDY